MLNHLNNTNQGSIHHYNHNFKHNPNHDFRREVNHGTSHSYSTNSTKCNAKYNTSKSTNYNCNFVQVFTESLHFLAFKDLGIANFRSTSLKIGQTPLFIFKSFLQAQEYLTNVSKDVQVLSKVFCPGPLVLILNLKPRYQQKLKLSKIAVYVPSKLKLRQDLKECKPGRVPQLKAPFLALHTLVAPSLNFETNYANYPTGIQPTVLDCSTPHQISLINYGAIGLKDLQEVLHLQISIDTHKAEEKIINIQDYKKYPQNSKILQIKDLEFQPHQKYLLLGSKEKLREKFKNIPNTYFKHLTHENLTFLNLGSRTSPRNIAKNLWGKLNYIQNSSFDSYFWIHEKFGNDNFGKIVNSFLSEVFLAGHSRFILK